ncbi:MAG: hypothetical protein ACJ788_09640, partial [Ktedonobacteraceae bacterium]
TKIEMQELRQIDVGISKSHHVSCFVATPFEGYDLVLEALREVLEDKPYFWQVIRADEEQLDPTIYGSVFKHIARAHCYIAEVSNHNFNVGLELGIMQQFHERPKILLRHAGARPVPADLKGAIYIEYPDLKDLRKDDLIKLLQSQLARVKELKTIRGEASYLSPIILNRFGLDLNLSERITREFLTVEEFVKADPKTVARKLDKAPGLVHELQEYVYNIYDLPQTES